MRGKFEEVKSSMDRITVAELRKAQATSEHDEQAALIQWCDSDEIKRQFPELQLLFAIPNGAKLPYSRNRKGQRFSREALKLKAEGLRSGVPDLCLPIPRKGWHGLFIEMKSAKGKATDNQLDWIASLINQGYCAVICRGAEEAKQELIAYLEGRDDK